PERAVGVGLNEELDRLAALTQQLQEHMAGPILPSESAQPGTVPAARTSAREAWSAVVILLLFIVAGFAWTSSQLEEKDQQVMLLTRQIDEKQTAILSYQQQIKRLREDLAQSQAKLRAAEKQLKARPDARLFD